MPYQKVEPDPDILVPSIVAARDVVRGYGPAKSFFGPWLSEQVEEKSLRALFFSLDPIVLLLNIAGWTVTEMVIGPAPDLLDQAITVRFRDGWVDEFTEGGRVWWNEAGTDHPGTPWACALRLYARKAFGPNVVLGEGIAIEPSHPAFHRPADDDEALYFDRLLILSDPGAADFTSFVVASHELLFGADGVRTALIEDLLAVCQARVTDSHVPAGLLGMYSPQYWWVPAQMDASSATRAAMTLEFAELGWALVDAELGDLTKFGAFLDEETRAPDLIEILGRRSLLDRVKGLIKAGAPPELLAHVEQWLAAVEAYAEGVRMRMSSARAMTYTQALFVAQTVGALDFLGTIGMEGARLDPAHAGGMYINGPKTRSAQAAKIRVQCFEAWMWWEADHARSLAVLAGLRAALDDVARNLPVEVQLEEQRMWITLDRGKVHDAELLLVDAVDRVDFLIATTDAGEDLIRQTLDTVGYALTVADPFWLEEWDQFGQDTWAGAARDFVAAFIAGFVAIVEPKLPELAESGRANLGNAMLGSLLQPIFLAGVVYGAGESIDQAIADLLPWIDDPESQIQKIIDGLSALLAQEEETVGDALGQAAGEGALELAERLMGQPDPWHYAFEAGRIAGPLILNVVLELIFEVYVAARLAAFGLRALRKTLDGMEEFALTREAARALAHYQPPFPPWHDGIYAAAEGGDVAVGGGDLVTVAWEDHPDVWLTQKLTPDTRVALLDLDVEPATRNVVLGTLADSERAAPFAKALEAVLDSPGSAATHADMLDHVAADAGKANALAAAGAVDPPISAEGLPRFQAGAPEKVDEAIAQSIADGSTIRPSDALGDDDIDGRLLDRADEAWDLSKDVIVAEKISRYGMTAWNTPPGSFNHVPGPHGSTQVQGWLSRVDMARDRAIAKNVRDKAPQIAAPFHATHLVPRTMGGPPDAWNLIAANPRINMSYIKVTENIMDKLLNGQPPREVYLIIDIKYAANGLPDSVIYNIFVKSDAGVPEPFDNAWIAANPMAGPNKKWLPQRRAERWLAVIPEG